VIGIKHKTSQNGWRLLATLGSLSLNLGFIIVGGYFIGKLLEDYYHWRNMKLFGVIAGIILGLYQTFVIAYRVGKTK
jgi:flagellar biogenesis protein FliO